MKRRWLVRGVKFLVIAAVGVTAASAVVMTLWNWVVPVTFGLPALSLGRAFALLVLSRLLLGGLFGGLGRRMHWRHRMRDRWEQMSPEQRERFMAGMRRGCGRFESGAATPVA
jgi:hypothetical protein